MRVQPYADRYLMADVETGRDGDLAVINIDASGVLESFPLPNGRRRFVTWDPLPSDSSDAGRAAAAACRAARRGARTPRRRRSTIGAAFEVRRAVAPALRRGGLFVIGDTAHEVSPIGGQGMNLGLLDAATLAPLLAAWVRTGAAPEQELAAWERRRRGLSADGRRARDGQHVARSGARSPRPTRVRRAGLRVALRPPGARLLAHAYSMGFDRDA